MGTPSISARKVHKVLFAYDQLNYAGLKPEIHDQFKLPVLTDGEKTDRVNENNFKKTDDFLTSQFFKKMNMFIFAV